MRIGLPTGRDAKGEAKATKASEKRRLKVRLALLFGFFVKGVSQ
jgi:hypothetical protein